MTAQFYENLADFNRVELCNGIGEALDIGEKKKEENSGMCTKIFRGLLSISLLGAVLNYMLFGSKGFRMSKFQNMQTASTKK